MAKPFYLERRVQGAMGFASAPHHFTAQFDNAKLVTDCRCAAESPGDAKARL